MSDQTIECPHCGQHIPLSQALSHQLTAQVQQQLKREKDKLAEQQKQLEKQQSEQAEQFKKQQESQEKEFQKKLESREEAWTQKMENEKKKLWALAQEKASEKQATQLKDLQEQLAEQKKRDEESQKEQLELLKKLREADDKARKSEVELQKKLAEETQKIYDKAKAETTEEQRLKIAEKDKQMAIMQKTIEDLRRQSQQGSMQIQGEVQEEDLKEILQTQFPRDVIEDVPAGVNGADLIQKVNAAMGSSSGVIVWESKNTKSFSEQWISKLKSDQALVKGDVAILVTQVLPAEIKNFAQYKGVWLTSPQYALELAVVLRVHLATVSQAKQALQGQDEKMTMLFRYLTGPEFKNRIENIALTFIDMRSDLDTEKRSFERIWKKREKQIEKIMLSTSNMYGDLQGIIGGALPEIQQLELDSGADELTLFEDKQ